MGTSIRRLAAFGIAALAFGSTFALAAAPGAPTRGDAEAVFNGTFTGGAAILAHNPDAEGASAGFSYSPDGVRINPLQNGRTYCSAGWHLVSLGLVVDPSLYPSLQALFADLSSSQIAFVLDGAALDVTRTAVTPMNDPAVFGFDSAFGVNFGAFLPPGGLTLGPHQLETTITTPGFPPGVLVIGFTVVSC